MSSEPLFFFVFLAAVIALLSIDLGVFNREEKEINFKTAMYMSIGWVCLALLFYGFLFLKADLIHGITNQVDLDRINILNKHKLVFASDNYLLNLAKYKSQVALEFITGYLIEYALSVDNIFIIVLIFSSFKVDPKHYHRVLFWGILGAIVMRFLFIFSGGLLIKKFEWILYILGAFLVYSGLKLLFSKEEKDKIDTEHHPVIEFCRKYFRVHTKFEGRQFFYRKNGLLYITPLFIVLLIIEFTDLIFAVDSIPAIFAVTKDSYIVFFSNIFAILGLRSMFFFLVNIINKFHLLKKGLGIILSFIGFKMIFEKYLHELGIGTSFSLVFILIVLTASIVGSLFYTPKEK